MQSFDGSRAEPFFSLGRCFPIEEVFLDWARQIHKENPVVDAHFDLAAEVYERRLAESGTWWSGVICRIFRRRD